MRRMEKWVEKWAEKWALPPSFSPDTVKGRSESAGSGRMRGRRAYHASSPNPSFLWETRRERKDGNGRRRERQRKKKSVHISTVLVLYLIENRKRAKDEGSIKRPPVTGPTIEEASTRSNLNCRISFQTICSVD